MAFMCPIRIGRSKKRRDRQGEKPAAPAIGRITGSASIETLVRVGLEKEHGLGPNSEVVVLHDFTPCVDDEIGVKRGEIVHTLYQENDWVYVISGSREGFIPQSYCVPVDSPMAQVALSISKKSPRERLSEEHHHHQQSSLESSIAHSDIESVDTPSCLTDVHPFFKDPAGRFLVLYSFIARDENDISVERGELVTVLNREDADWFWVQRYNGHEGFVPSAFIFPADVINSHAQSPEVSSEAQSVTTGATTTLRQEATSQKPLASSKQVDKLLDSIDFKDLTFSANNDSASAQKEYRYDTKSGTVSLHTYHNTADRAFPTTRNNLGSSEHLTSNNLNLNASTTASQWTTTPAPDGAIEGDNTTNSNTLKTTPYREREGSSINNTRKSTMSQQNRNTSVGNCRLQDHNVSGNQTKDVEDGESGRTHSHHHHSSGKNSSGQDSEASGKENDSQRNGPSELVPHGAKASGQDAPHTGNDSEVASIVQSETPYRAKATEFIVMYDHETDAEYELPIQRKELVYADLNCQNADGWYWVYSPRLNEYGYVPRGFVMESRPATTSL